MPEPTPISYELVPSHLVGPTSDDFILPHEKISVAALAGFKLVSFSPLANQETLTNQVHHLVGANEPDTELQNKVLQSLIPPPLVVLHRFLKSCLEGSLPNGASIAYEGHHLPQNVLDIWMVLAAVHRVQGRWDKSLKWMRRQERKNGALYDKVVNLLRNLSWGGMVQGFDSTGPCPISMIAVYLSDDWLSDEHMHQFTELVERRLLGDARHASETYILGPWFSTHLSQFDDTPDHPYLERIGQDLASGRRKRIVSMRNVGADHWIAFVIDSGTASIAVGDSFKKPHPSFVSATSRWVKRHMKHTYQQTTLPCTRQEDGFSCGILTMNAIEHYLDPEHYPLVSKTPHALAASRMSRAIDAITHHLDSVRRSSHSNIVIY
jgi:hypothetical protein